MALSGGFDADPANGDFRMEPRELCCSARICQPFLRAVRGSAADVPEWRQPVEALDLDARLPIPILNQLLEGLIALSGDPDLGLKAAREWSPGDGGVLDHAFTSASTVRDAILAVGRYIQLFSDAVEINLVTVGSQAFLRHDHQIAIPRAARDFSLGALYRALHCVWASGAGASARVLMAHGAPCDTTEYVRTFERLPIEFGAPFYGFAFDADSLDARLVSADIGLHLVVCNHADLMLKERSLERQFTNKVRKALAAELDGGTPSIVHVASRLHMSARTLERKLDREGTRFSTLLAELRRELAVQFVKNPGIELGEIAYRLGFSQAGSFFRAFKRWTGETPSRYRRGRTPPVGPPKTEC